ncbi:hypothetical protein LY625_03860 [Lysobacter sp. GX 14042]|uniref:hypothetical protein n=1 Tax=Lysobacter sp. GX 14042 TaxID=2907155 RepID=UPI001F2363D3|nr:hypothetical protein [Lysobacter sp. GX 14042]MCE7031760.1 hypothetical protein [Lysobacter sp. GX 14042]
MTYWPTTPIRRDELATAVRTASRQDEAVMAVYRAAGRPLSASQVWRSCEAQGRRWPLTSIRRSITNLMNAGALVHLPTQTRTGIYGRPETLYALPEREGRAAA